MKKDNLCKKIITLLLILFMLLAQSYAIVSEASNIESSKKSTAYNSKPIFYGTIGINLKVGDVLDLNNPVFRIFAKDFYDGDLTQEIKIVENTVNTSKEGSYYIKYYVSNSAGNANEITVSVKVNNKQERSVKKQLYECEDFWNMNLISTDRGNYHDRQNLGIYLKSGASVKVKTVTKGLQISGEFLNNDEKTELKFELKNDWTTITTKYDSVPFIRSTEVSTDTAVIEINIEDMYKTNSLIKPLDYYLYGDDEDEFLSQWSKSKNSYAVMEDDRVTFLVPYRDKNKITVEDNSANPYYFETFKELFDFYQDIFKMYDSFIGLEDYATERINQNVKTKYFVKANKNGVGMGYYTKDHTAYNGDNIEYYFYKNWLILHELGHGYDYPLREGNVYLREAANNILAYYYEQTYLTEKDEGWMGDILKNEKYWNDARKNLKGKFNDIKDKTYIGTDQYHVRLYMMINALNKIGPEKGMSTLYKQARKDKNEGLIVTTADLIANSFSEVSKYNLIPYLESWKIEVSKNLKQKIKDKEYPAIYYLRDLVNSDNMAKKIREELNLEGMYSLVSNKDIEKYNLTGSANIQLSEEDYSKLKGQSLLVKSGSEIVKSILIESKDINITNIPIGVYSLEITNKDYDIDAEYLIIKENQVTSMSILFVKKEVSDLINKPIEKEEIVPNKGKNIEEVIIVPPKKITYTKGDKLDLEGLNIIVIYNDNSVEAVNKGYKIKGYDKNKVGKQTLTISYAGYERSFDIIVNKVVVQANKKEDTKENNKQENDKINDRIEEDREVVDRFELKDLLFILMSIVVIITVLLLVLNIISKKTERK